MKTSPEPFRRGFVDEAAQQLPAFDEALHARVMSDLVAASRSTPRPLTLSSPSRGEGKDWRVLVWAGLGLAGCAAAVLFLVRPAAVQPGDDLSTSVAAVASAASPRLVAVLPMQTVRHNITAFHDDTRRLADFVTDQLNVLPDPG